MASKRFGSAGTDPAPRSVTEDAIMQNFDGCGDLAEGVTQIDPELRHEMIATAAYFIAEQRGFIPGHEEEDWHRAEAAIDRQLPRLLAQD
jgi:hypothetical protein